MTIQARPTVYKGIAMRSRLEASWAEAFDKEGWEWRYEPRAYADETGQYLPDFEMETASGQPWFVEIKGTVEILDLPSVLNRIAIVQSSLPDAVLTLFVGRWDEDFVQFWKLGQASWIVGGTKATNTTSSLKP